MVVAVQTRTKEDNAAVTVHEWHASSYLTRISTKDGTSNVKYLRKQTLIDLLSQVEDGMAFGLKSLSLSPSLGQGEFYLALSWMLANGLVHKVKGSLYVIPSIEAVRRRWNDSLRAANL